MKIISHNGYKFRVNQRGAIGQVFIWDENHPRRAAFHQIGIDGVTVACVVLKPDERGIFYSALDVAFEVYEKMF